jgi:hypothetical protein
VIDLLKHYGWLLPTIWILAGCAWQTWDDIRKEDVRLEEQGLHWPTSNLLHYAFAICVWISFAASLALVSYVLLNAVLG